MPMTDPTVGGTTLVRTAINSPNYTPGSDGWSINANGSAEFNSLIARGAIVTDSVSLYYNGSPAAGNLALSIAPEAGTDQYGNDYVEGIGIYDSGATIGQWSADGGWQITNTDGTYATIADAGFNNVVMQLGTGQEQYPGNIGSGPTGDTVYTAVGSATMAGATGLEAVIGVLAAPPGGGNGSISGEQRGMSGTVPLLDQNPTATTDPPSFMHVATYSATPNASGVIAFNHGCSFTPSKTFISPVGGTFTQWDVTAFSASTVTMTVRNSTGALVTSGTCFFYALMFG